MDKEKLEGLIIDYIDGRLSKEQCVQLEQELAQNNDARKLYEQMREVMQVMDRSENIEPSSALKNNFEKVLQKEMRVQDAAKTIRFSPVFYRVAAAIALVLSGVAIGYWINKNQRHEEELLVLKKQMEEVKSMVISKLDNQQSASQRMIGVSVALDMDKPDDEIVSALIHTMNEDGNTNVRLAALEALGKFYHQQHVREALIQSLKKQTDPVVQIALIRLMVEMKEKDSLKELQRISNDDEVLPAVKDEAHAGIIRLS
jgi:HEAT repeats